MNKGADQTSRMYMLVCAFVVRKPLKIHIGFLALRPIKYIGFSQTCMHCRVILCSLVTVPDEKAALFA